MAGNKALKKFLESKIPKKGGGPSQRDINIYKEPNTHSEIIGTIKAGEFINWINKSICENKEWIRCDKNQNFGYVIGTNEDGNYNFNVDKIIKSPEKKSEVFITDNSTYSTLTNEDLKKGEEALYEILNDNSLDNSINEKEGQGLVNLNYLDNSYLENGKHLELGQVDESLGLDKSNDGDFSNFKIKIANDLELKEHEQRENEIFSQIEKGQKPINIKFHPEENIEKKEEEYTEKKEEESNTFKRNISPIIGEEDLGLDNLNDIDLSNCNIKIANDLELKKQEKLKNEIFSQLEKGQKPIIAKYPLEENPEKKEESTEKKEEESDTFKRIISPIVELIDFFVPINSGYKALFGEDLITHEKINEKERINCALSTLPPFKIINKYRKLNKFLNINNKSCQKISKAIVKNSLEKIIQKIPNKLFKNISEGQIDIKLFTIKLKNGQGSKAPNGWILERDTAGHGGSYYKLKNEKGKRIASLTKKGYIINK